MRKPPKYIRKVSPRRTDQMAQYAKVKAKFLEENPYCFRCNERIPPKYRQLHHHFGRVHALICWVPGFRMLCGACHAWVESHRNDAVSLGLRAPNNLFGRPSLVIPTTL